LSEVPDADDTLRFIREIAALDQANQTFVLHVLVTAAVLDGRLTRAERRLLAQAFAACHRKLDMKRIRYVVATFRAGQPMTDAIESTVGDRQSSDVRFSSSACESG